MTPPLFVFKIVQLSQSIEDIQKKVDENNDRIQTLIKSLNT